MSDLNVMMREHALAGLNTQLDTAVTNGDTEAARKITADIAKLAVSTQPKGPPYSDAEIRAELNKLDWFGVDPKKSGLAIALGKDMNIHKFASAVEFAAALVKAVEEEFKPAVVVKEPDENETDEEREEREAKEAEEAEAAAAAAAKAKRKTDGPGEGDAGGRASVRARSGPWTKLSDAPSDVRKEIERTADKFVSRSGDPKVVKENRDKFVSRALESQYAIHQRAKGKK